MARTSGGDRVAVVTGGNRGLGLELVRRLAERDMRVVLACRVAEQGRAAIERLGGLADRVAVRQLDVGDADSIGWFVTWLGRRLGRCDVLVNTAGAVPDDDMAAAGVDLDLVRRTFEANVFGPWRLVQAVTPLMRAAGYGRIVTVAREPGRDASAYRVSRGAVDALTRVFADELAGDGILVNACGPDRSADTPVWLATLPDGGPTGLTTS